MCETSQKRYVYIRCKYCGEIYNAHNDKPHICSESIEDNFPNVWDPKQKII